MTIDYGTNEVKIAGRRVKVFETTAGHLCIRLHPDTMKTYKEQTGGFRDDGRVVTEMPDSQRDGSLEDWG